MNENLQQLLRELESGIDTNAVNSPFYRRSVGAVEELLKKAESESGNIFMKGYASTSAPDLANEIIPPDSWEKHIVRYKNNPIVCWMHDKKMPIGKVNNLHIDEKGLYLDEIELIRDIPIVKEFLGPLVMHGVLRQLSVGFLSLDGHYEKGFWYHDENYLIENSIVSVACNPEAEAEIVRGFSFAKSAGVSTLDELIRSYHYGVIGENDRQKYFTMSTKDVLNMKEGSVDFIDVVATSDEDESLVKSDEPAVSKLPKYHKEYEKYGKLTYAAFNNGSKTFMFPMAVKTETGYKFDFDVLAISMCRLLGAKGKANYTSETFKSILDRMCKVYARLDKAVPTVDLGDGPVPINEVSVDFVGEIEYRKVTFHENENVIFANSVLRSDLKNLATFVNSLGPDSRFDLIGNLKEFFSTVSIYGWVESEEDAAKLSELLAIIANEGDGVEDDDDEGAGAYSGEPYKAELDKFYEALKGYNKEV